MRISIKRRLLISNILMVVIPIVLTFALLIGAFFILLNGVGISAITSVSPDIPIEQGPLLDFDFSGMEFPVEDAILVYQLETGVHVLILPEHMNPRFEGINLSEERMFTDISLVSEDLLQVITSFEAHQGLILLALVVFVFLVNRILTKFVFKPIVTSLNVLTKGVHEISVGNLSYRLKHDMGNEFDVVGASFNEMATRLYEMVEQRKIDEKNRKELIAGISHDLRTPLTSIRTYTEGIELGMATTPEKQEKYLATIKKKTKDIEHIINQLFLFSKLDIGEFPIRLDKRNVGDLLTDFVQMVAEEYLEKGLRIELRKQIEDDYFLVDSVQLRNVLINILENSVKYGKNPDGRVLIEYVNDNGNIVITLTDNGTGVPDDDLSKLFDVFYRSDRARSNPGQGSGLGLAISAKMIERMDGSIGATNADGGGLQIMLKLPVIKGES